MRKLTKQLLRDSQGAFVLAIEVYNKPSGNYRNQAFCMLLTNAWELLLKARLYEESGGKKLSVFRPKERNVKRQSITIDNAVAKLFPDPHDPIAANIRYISELRNEATHLVIEEFNPYYSRAFQSSVLNYLARIREWFSIEGASLLPPGLLALVSGENLPDMRQIRKNYSTEEFDTLLSWQSRYNQLQLLGEQAALSIQHRVAIVNNPKKADVVLSAGVGKGTPTIAVVSRTRSVEETHPHLTSAVLAKVNIRLNGKLTVSDYDFQSYLYATGLKKDNNDYHWKPLHSSSQYSDLLIDRFYEALNENTAAKIAAWRKRYLSHQRQKRERKYAA